MVTRTDFPVFQQIYSTHHCWRLHKGYTILADKVMRNQILEVVGKMHSLYDVPFTEQSSEQLQNAYKLLTQSIEQGISFDDRFLDDLIDEIIRCCIESKV